ncbi:CotH kinase family protein [Moorella sulfitireducens]|uniref:CotH kinase family protein n=1 Tax=Neomoorella sulfitireducens TaxID=2972948 RepID=UPI0021ABAE35|nr:CotH kinase family protein [Moorella sulfitireducens]
MVNVRTALLSLVMVVFTALLTLAGAMFGTGAVTVYGDEYMTKYFQRDKVMEINIQIDRADWDYLIENAAREEFCTATVIVNGDVYPLVRIRAKGNSSLSSVARSDSNRYSFKINFNDINENLTMAGLTQLNLNNCFSDPSYMREYLSYQIFEAMGVPVPAFAYAAVYVNGEYFGLYLAVESILEPYLERNFSNITGDLYKSVGNTLKYNGPDPENYTGLQVKSTLKNANWSKLIKMLEALNSGVDIEKYLDVDTALRYLAVSTALANFDSYQGNFAHNYYLYEQDGVFTILPWDLNMSFGGFQFGGDTSKVYIDEPTQGAVADRPLIAALLANEEYRETYHAYLEEIATKYLSGGYLEKETARVFNLISEYVRTDPTAFYTYDQFVKSISGTIQGGAMGDENQAEDAAQDQQNEGVTRGFQMGGVREFGSNVPGLLEFAASMSQSILKQLSGELPSTNNGSGSGGGMGMVRGRVPDQAAQNRGMIPPGNQNMGAENRGMIPDNQNMEALEAIREEIRQAGGLTDEVREKAREAGIPDNVIEMLAAGRVGQPPGGMPPGRGAGDMRPAGMGAPRNGPVDNTALISLLVSGSAITLGLIMALFFRRRRYVKA